MNLMFLDSIEKETYGGMEEWVRLVASGLVAKGHRVRVVGRPDSRFLERLERETEHVQLTGLEISGDFNPATISALKRLMVEDGTEIIVTNFNKDLRLGGLAARLEGNVRVVWSIGLDITKDSLIHRILSPRLFDGVLVPSQALKSQITRHGYINADDVEVIPIGIPDITVGDSDDVRQQFRSHFNIHPNAIVGVTLGRFVEQKGHRYLLEALSLVAKDFPGLHLLWCGDGPMLADLKSIAQKHGLENRIVFAGMLDDVVPALVSADMMIHPSVEEPFGIAVLEGMRAGLPIVASHVGGIPEVVGDCAILVPPRDAKSLAEGINRALNDAPSQISIADRGRRRYEEHFSVNAMISRLESYFQSMLQTEKRHG